MKVVAEGKKALFASAAYTDKGKNEAQTPKGWLLHTVNLKPHFYFQTVLTNSECPGPGHSLKERKLAWMLICISCYAVPPLLLKK